MNTPNSNYRQLIRNLRTNQKLRIHQPPIELQAIAKYLRQHNITTHIRAPGENCNLPLNILPIWRLDCHNNKRHEIIIKDNTLTIRNIINRADNTPTYDQPPHTINLNDPDSLPNIIKIIK